MADGADICPKTIDQKMHGEFGGRRARAGKGPALHVCDDQIVRSHHAFADAGGSGEHA